MSITITRARGTVEFCTDLALRSQWERLTAELKSLGERADLRLGNPEVAEKAAEIQAVEKQMVDKTLVFELEALRRKEWAEYEAKHPPHDDVQNDKAYSVHIATFIDDVYTNTKTIVGVTNKATGETHDFDPTKEWKELADDMSDGQFSNFALKLLSLNRGGGGTPFSQAASQLIHDSAPNSSSPSN